MRPTPGQRPAHRRRSPPPARQPHQRGASIAAVTGLLGLGFRRSCLAKARHASSARFAIDGGSKIRLTRRFPHRGHIIRSRKPDKGILRPLASKSASQGSARPDDGSSPLSACTRASRRDSAHEHASRRLGPRRGFRPVSEQNENTPPRQARLPIIATSEVVARQPYHRTVAPIDFQHFAGVGSLHSTLVRSPIGLWLQCPGATGSVAFSVSGWADRNARPSSPGRANRSIRSRSWRASRPRRSGRTPVRRSCALRRAHANEDGSSTASARATILRSGGGDLSASVRLSRASRWGKN